jgi:hypothetical protein
VLGVFGCFGNTFSTVILSLRILAINGCFVVGLCLKHVIYL